MAATPRYGYPEVPRLSTSRKEPEWLDAKSWGTWGGDRTVTPLPPRPVCTSENQPFTPDFFPQSLMGALHVRGRGNVGMEQLPGKRLDGITSHQERDLAADVARIHEAGITTVVTLVEDFEMAKCRRPQLIAELHAAGLATMHYPIVDMSVPKDMSTFHRIVRQIAQRVRRGERVLVHCRGGYGRTGLVVAAVLVYLGISPEKAVRWTRATRKGTIQTQEQERWVHRYAEALARAREEVEVR